MCWDERYERALHLFGRAPNAFVAAEVTRVPSGSEAIENGAGEARTLLRLAREHGHRVTAVGFSVETLATVRRQADAGDIVLESIEADARSWSSDGRWDAAIVTSLQLIPHERPRLYELLRDIVRPDGWIFGEWFRPAHLNGTFDRMGPSTLDRRVPPGDIESAFSCDEIVRCDSEDVVLQEGERLNGRVTVVRAVIQRSPGDGRVAS